MQSEGRKYRFPYLSGLKHRMAGLTDMKPVALLALPIKAVRTNESQQPAKKDNRRCSTSLCPLIDCKALSEK